MILIVTDSWPFMLEQDFNIFLKGPGMFPCNSVFSQSSLFLCGWFPLLKKVPGGVLLFNCCHGPCPGHVLECQSCRIWSCQSSAAFLVTPQCLTSSHALPLSGHNDFANLVSHKDVLVPFLGTASAFSCDVFNRT